MSTRESRRLKEKRSMIPFGDIMLPVIGLVAVGLLIVGVKLFFLSGPKVPGYSSVSSPDPASSGQISQPAGTGEKKTATSRPQSSAPSGGKKPVLAAPVSGKQPSAGAVKAPVMPEASPVAEPPAAKPVKKTVPAPAPRPTASPQRPVPPSNSKWGVQIGSFSSREGAETVRRQAAKAGFSAGISSALVSGKKYFRVTVPAGNSRKEAESLAGTLKKAGFPVFVVGMR